MKACALIQTIKTVLINILYTMQMELYNLFLQFVLILTAFINLVLENESLIDLLLFVTVSVINIQPAGELPMRSQML